MQKFYLLATILGALVPYAAFVPWLTTHGADLPLFLADAIANPISIFAWLDVLFAALTLLAFIVSNAISEKITHWYWALFATLLIGVSCGLPLYLYLKERHRASLCS
ncbi:hypothetical protein HR45_04530 [Shewanella mangrovi]|uniref:DUF2834 domain-containing protein n=1 Tax=Shewanella mangrovi TaxID=1515746 RepID=A0A094JKW2_9GAMM|nr:DUF2834 domain-containing protein [Shewanella mangrovi]KFZ38694.1 hypothetical protein HR45_04530 [Shewanella mangrovi]